MDVKQRPSLFPSETCEAEYNKLQALHESGELYNQPRGITGDELSAYLNDVLQRIHG